MGGGFYFSGMAINSLNDSYEYDPSTNAWSSTPSIPVSGGTTFSLNNVGYVVNNQNVYAYYPNTIAGVGTWAQLGNFPIAGFSSFGFGLSNGKGYIGGYLPGNAFYSYTPATDQWCQEQSLPINTCRNSFAIGDKGFLISFTVNSTTGTNDFLKYSPSPPFTIVGFNNPAATLCTNTVTVTSDCSIQSNNIYTVYVSKPGFPSTIVGTHLGNNTLTTIPLNLMGLNGSNYKLWVTSSSPKSSPATLTGVKLSSTPAIPSAITGSMNICNGIPRNYMSNTPVGTSISWSVTGTGSILSVSGVRNKNMALQSSTTGSISLAAYAINGAGCHSIPAVLTVTNNSKPFPSITGANVVCQNTTNIYAITSVAGVIYTWNTDFPGSTISGSQFYVSSNIPGNYSITCTGFDISCGLNDVTTFKVTVQAPYIGSISGLGSVCTASTQTYTATFQTLTGFSWSFSNGNASIFSSLNAVSLTGVSVGTGNLNVTATNTCGTGNASFPITVSSTSLAVPVITGISSFCPDGLPHTYSINNTAPGVTFAWTFTGMGTFSSITNQATLSSTIPGTGILLAEATNICGTKSASPPLSITIINFPVTPTITGANQLCNNVIPYPYTTVATANTLYHWSVTGAAFCINCSNVTASINVAPTFPSTGTINLSTTDQITGCNSATSIFNFTTNPAFSIPTVSGMTLLCNGQSTVFTAQTFPGVSYNWFFDGGYPSQSIVFNQNMATVTAINLASQSLLHVQSIYSCYTPDALVPIAVYSVPMVPTIAGANAVCVGNPTVYSVANQPGMTYAWSVSGPGNMVMAGNTITLTGTAAGTVTLSATVISANCGTVTSATFPVTITDVPAAPAISGPLSFCNSQSTTNYTVTSLNGVNYTWTSNFNPSIANGNTLQVFSTPIGLNYIKVFASNVCGNSSVTSINVQLDAPYTGTIVGSNLVCAPGSASYTLPSITGTSFSWSYNGSGATLNSLANLATLTGTTYEIAKLNATATNSCGVFTVPSFPITVSSLPVQPIITGSTQLCEQSTSLYTISTFAGETYSWNISGTGATYTSNYNKATLITTGAGNITLSVTSQSLCGNKGSAALNVTIFSYPVAPTITGCSNIHVNQTCVYTVNSVAGTVYNWVVSGAQGSIVYQGNTATLTGLSQGYVYVYAIATNGICSTTSTGFGVSIPSPDCLQMYYLDANDTFGSTTIGATGVTTTVTGGATFDGSYHALGSVVFSNGTYNFKPGTQFYVESNSLAGIATINSLATYINFTNATANVHQTLFTAACSTMWGGIVLNTNAIFNMDNYSEVKDAYSGMFANTNTQYKISNSSFVNNYDGLIDNYRSPSTPVSFTNNAVISNPDLLKAPYLPGMLYGQAAKYYSNYGLYLSGDFANTVYNGNTITGAIFGIAGSGSNITFSGNYFTNNVVYNMLIATSGTSNQSVQLVNNHINMNNNVNYNTVLNLANSGASQRDGISLMGLASVLNNTIVGIFPDISGTNPQRGISISTQYNNNLQSFKVSNNQVSQVVQGMALDLTPTYSMGISLSGNNMQNNLNGIYARAFNLYTLPADIQINCNSFTNTSGLNSVNGINVLLGNYLQDQGSTTAPAPGNKFIGYTGGITNSFAIVNNGALFNYFVNLAEETTPTKGGTGGLGTPFTSNSAQCSTKGYHTGNGRMEAQEQLVTIPLTIQQKMDSLKFKVGSISIMKKYQSDIVNYFVTNNDLPGVESYSDSIVNCNREAYYTFYLYLMQTYDQKGDIASSNRCKTALLNPNPNDVEIKARIQFFNLMKEPMKGSDVSHLNFNPNAPLGNLNVSDSTALAALARSGTSVASSALAQLKQYYPLFNCNTDITYQANYNSINCTSQNSNARKTISSDVALGVLGNAIPNPANNQTVISYTLVDMSLDAEIQINDVVTGSLMKVIPLLDKTKQGTVTVNLDEFSSGVYSYKLVISGKTIGVKKLVIIK